MINKTLKTFLNEIDSSSSIPTEVSVNATIAIFSVCLIKKSILQTQINKAFDSYTKGERGQLEEAAMKMDTFRSTFETLSMDSNKAYQNYLQACESEKQDLINSALLIYINSSYTIALTCIDAFIAIDNMKDLLNKKTVKEVLTATLHLKTVYQCALNSIKSSVDLLSSESMSEDLAEFLVQKKKIESDIENIVVFCERKI